jgi:hypothetical protein
VVFSLPVRADVVLFVRRGFLWVVQRVRTLFQAVTELKEDVFCPSVESLLVTTRYRGAHMPLTGVLPVKRWYRRLSNSDWESSQAPGSLQTAQHSLLGSLDQ